jgi:hypothetical protein
MALVDSSGQRRLAIVADTAGCEELIGQSLYIHRAVHITTGKYGCPTLAGGFLAHLAILRTYSTREGSE